MKFKVSSAELLHSLSSVLRVIVNKSTSPILENFLFVLSEDSLEVTAADLGMTMKIRVPIAEVEETGSVAVPAKILTDTLKEFPDIPIAFSTGIANNTLELKWQSGVANIPVFPAEDYPALAAIQGDSTKVTLPADILLEGINDTIYATADEEVRPVMNGIFVELNPDSLAFVATDSHKLVCYNRLDIATEQPASFILPKKPASILRTILPKAESDITIQFDTKNAYFTFDSTIVVCTLLEGNYPAYRSVIPTNNTNRLYIQRTELLNSVKRVAVCANPATAILKFSLSYNQLTISSQDLSISVSANETIPCEYDGTAMNIGFKSSFIVDVLSNIPFDNLCFELSDSAKAALILNGGEKEPNEEIKTLLMPVRIPV
ncbi:MAG: DNA polymerase III subunit beta [Bacteroidales bacterium]|nr:DNA polymerase III subunit beta [Bacteroidales bacterium]